MWNLSLETLLSCLKTVRQKDSSEFVMNVKLAFTCALIAVASARAQEVFNPADLGAAPLTREQIDRNNVVNYGLVLFNSFDDNGVGSGRAHRKNLIFFIQPQTRMLINRPRIESRVLYGPGVGYRSGGGRRIGMSGNP